MKPETFQEALAVDVELLGKWIPEGESGEYTRRVGLPRPEIEWSHLWSRPLTAIDLDDSEGGPLQVD